MKTRFTIQQDHPGNEVETPLNRSDPSRVTQRDRLREQLKFIPIRNESTMVFILLGLSISLFAATLIALITTFSNQSLAKRGKVYVQMENGQTEVAQEFDVQHRDPKVIQSTVTAWIQLTYEWDNRIPGSEAVDKGVKVDRQVVVPTKVYLGSYLLQDGFRDAFLEQLGSTIIPKNVSTSTLRSIVRFYSIGTPTQISESQWQVDVVATRIESSPTQMLREVPMNWTITVQSIPYVPPVFGKDEPLVWRQKIYELLSNGLMITDIVPLKVKS
jgi:hypothetical protein